MWRMLMREDGSKGTAAKITEYQTHQIQGWDDAAVDGGNKW